MIRGRKITFLPKPDKLVDISSYRVALTSSLFKHDIVIFEIKKSCVLIIIILELQRMKEKNYWYNKFILIHFSPICNGGLPHIACRPQTNSLKKISLFDVYFRLGKVKLIILYSLNL